MKANEYYRVVTMDRANLLERLIEAYPKLRSLVPGEILKMLV